MIKPFNFFKGFTGFYSDEYTLSLPLIRRMSGRTIAQDLVSVQPMGSPDSALHILRNSFYGAMGLRDIAVIASSIQNFNNWRNENFDRNSICIITNGDFTYTDENNQTTRYTAITTINDCRGYTFDDYILTDRIHDILSSGYNETIDHIHQLVDQVGLNLR
jgi:hypothetical protein